jgi:uncharacterized membrane protein YkvA (DUF1232 family)
MVPDFEKNKAEDILEGTVEQSRKILEDPDELERLLQRTEAKLQEIPIAGEILANIPTMISMIRSFVKKEYTEVPIGSILAMIGALLYLILPVDLIPDAIPAVGHLDDMAVLAACLKLADSDIREYRAWRERNTRLLETDYKET